MNVATRTLRPQAAPRETYVVAFVRPGNWSLIGYLARDRSCTTDIDDACPFSSGILARAAAASFNRAADGFHAYASSKTDEFYMRSGEMN